MLLQLIPPILNTCAILDNGNLYCWGSNFYYYLGAGGNQFATSEIPQIVNFATGRTVSSVALGQSFVCAILDDGSIKCWGSGNIYGTSTITLSSLPRTVDLGNGDTAVSISSGGGHVCAILDNGNLKCWGSNQFAQSGQDPTISGNSNIYSPQLVDLGVGRTASSVSLGYLHSCAILDDGSVKCWGDNSHGQLGIGPASAQHNPQTVDLGVGRTAVSLSLGKEHTCVVLDNGVLKCWGDNQYGQLGDGISYIDADTPQTINLGLGNLATSVASGDMQTCAILTDASLMCWGDNQFGQLGIGSTNDEYYPTFVNGFEQIIPLGRVYGTPTQSTPTQTYTFYGNNSVGSDTFDMDITVVPAYDYGNNTLVLTRNESMSARSPIITGGPYTVAISPPLPQGLNFEPSNGTIWGTPIFNQMPKTYSMNISNSTGYDNIAISIKIDDIPPEIVYDIENITLVSKLDY